MQAAAAVNGKPVGSDLALRLGGKTISSFVPLAGVAAEQVIRINLVADLIATRLKKLFHLVLSEIAAPIDDEHYAKDMIATAAIMSYEEQQLAKLVAILRREERTGVAVEVGCGTGRHSFILGQTFQEVYAFDISPG